MPKAPPASTTARLARTWNGRALPFARATQSRPVARPPSKAILRTSISARRRAPGGDGPRKVRDVHRLLGIQAAAGRAGAALIAAAGVPAQRLVPDAERLRAVAQELSVSAHALGVHRLDVEHLLGRRIVGVEFAGPRDPVLGRPPGEDRVGRPEARARVDHGRSADGPPDRGGDRRTALGDRQAAVAIERCRGRRAAPRGSCGGPGGGRPRARRRRARPRPGRRPRRRRRRPSRRWQRRTPRRPSARGGHPAPAGPPFERGRSATSHRISYPTAAWTRAVVSVSQARPGP